MIKPTPLWRHPQPLVLASGSLTRRDMLVKAGLPLLIDPAAIDERAVEEQVPPSMARPESVARHLALAKALEVSVRHPGHIVLGADQTLEHDGDILHKPATLAEARRQLLRLSASAHKLHSGFALVRDGRPLTSAVTSATLTMRDLTDPMLDAYLEAAGSQILQSVGGYQIEGHGSHLFHAVSGDHFTILGLPLFDVLAVLRQTGVVL